MKNPLPDFRIRWLLRSLCKGGNMEPKVNSLSEMGEAAIPKLIRAFTEESYNLRRGASEALIKMGKPAIPALIEALWHEDPLVLYHAAEALGAINDPSAIPALFEARESNNKTVAKLKSGRVFRGYKGLSKVGELWTMSEAHTPVSLCIADALSSMHPRGIEDLQFMAGMVRSKRKLELEGKISSEEMDSLIKIYRGWASHLSKVAREKHKNSKLQIPPRLRNLPRQKRSGAEISRRMVAGRRA